jgi:hypothetical protein
MSQRDVERTLGRLLTDDGFRQDFFLNPARACLALGVQLAPHEVDALLRLSRPRLVSFAGELDDRIRRLYIVEDGPESGGTPDPPHRESGAGSRPIAKATRRR